MAKLKECKVAQDGQTRGENEVYNAMFWHKRAKPQEDGSKLVSVGYDRLARQLRTGKNNVKKHCLRLMEKKAMVKIAEPLLAERVGTTYRVYNYPQILERRRAAGFTHYVNYKGASLLVDPTTQGQSDPGVHLNSILNDVRQAAASVVNLTPVSVVNLTMGIRGQSDHAFSTETFKREESTIASQHPAETAPVSESLDVAEQVQIGAASQEPPIEMPTIETSIDKKGSVECASTTSKEEDLASGCLAGTPTSQDLLFVNPKTGRVWMRGQEVECLSYEAKITMGEAKALLGDGNGKDAPTILSLLKKSWKGIKGAGNRAAYMRGIVRNQSAAKPTEQNPPPVPPPPLPLGALAEAEEDIIDLGPSNPAIGEWGDWDDTAPVAEPANDSAAVAAEEPFVHEDMATMKARHERKLQAERDEVHAAAMAPLNREMAKAAAQQAPADHHGASEPAVPAPPPAATTEPVRAPAPELSVRERIFGMLAAAAVDGRSVSLVVFRRDLGIGRDEATGALNTLVFAKKILEEGQENGRSYRLPRVDRRAAK